MCTPYVSVHSAGISSWVGSRYVRLLVVCQQFGALEHVVTNTSCHLCTMEFNATFYLIICGRTMMLPVGIVLLLSVWRLMVLLMMGLGPVDLFAKRRQTCTNETLRAYIVFDVCVCRVLCG